MQATNRREIGITKLFGCDLSDVKHVVIVEDIKVEDVHIGVRDTVNPGMACDISENRSAEGWEFTWSNAVTGKNMKTQFLQKTKDFYGFL